MRRLGASSTWGPVDLVRVGDALGLGTYGKVRSRVRGLPDVIGVLPSMALPDDVLTPGEGQVRGLLTAGSNWATSSCLAGPVATEVLEALEFHVSLDLYITDTNRYADYILPVPTFYEREDVALLWAGDMLRPALFATDAVIDRIGDTRDEWEIMDGLARRMGLGGAYSLRPMRWLARLGLRMPPRFLADILLRTGAAGDWYGLRRSGLSWSKLLTRHPHGVTVREDLPTGRLRKELRIKDKKINLAIPEIIDEVERLAGHTDDERFPFRAHGLRELRSMNTWMHNAARLMPESRGYAAVVNPADVEALGVTDGDHVTIVSAAGSMTVPVRLSDEMAPGNIAMPHGWGHNGGWRRANEAGGACSNVLASSAPEDTERLAGMAILSGIPVRLELPT